MGKNEFGYMSMDEDIINDWALDTVRGPIHTDRKGGAQEKSPPICQIPWKTHKSCVRVDGT